MFSLYEIVQNAQGGQAVDNLAKQFNISPDEADAAVKALLPSLSAAFIQRSAEPAAFGSILGAIGDEHHAAAFADAAVAQSNATLEKGAQTLTQLFGSQDTSAAAAQHAAGIAGLPPQLIQQMAPVIASMVLGGLGKGLANQGLGGMFGQLAGAAGPGGLGAILGSLLGGAPAAQAHPAGGQQPVDPQINPQAIPQANPQPGADGLGGLGAILGSLLGGAAPGARPQAPAPGAPDPAGGLASLGPLGGVLQSVLGGLLGGQPGAATGQAGAGQAGAQNAAPAGFDPGSLQTGLDALIKMMQPGTPAPPAERQAGLQDEINAILTGKRS